MKNARFLLHLLLITALSAALYPFPLLLAIWSGSAGWTAPVMTAALVLCVWLGTLYILLLRRQYARHPRWVNGGVWALTLLLCVLGSLFAPYPTRLAQVLLGITAGGCFFRRRTAGLSSAGTPGASQRVCRAVPMGLLFRLSDLSDQGKAAWSEGKLGLSEAFLKCICSTFRPTRLRCGMTPKCRVVASIKANGVMVPGLACPEKDGNG